MWLMFGLGFLSGIILMFGWACLTVAGRSDDLEEQWRRVNRSG